MKTYNGLFEKLIDETGIKQDILTASLEKRDRYYVRIRIGNIESIDITTQTTTELEDTIKKTKQLYLNGFDIEEKISKNINDGVVLKKRKIIKPLFFPEQIMNHGIIRVMETIMTKGMYEFSCGSIPKRGGHYGKKHIEKWIKHDSKNVKYVGKMDIKHFFGSVSIRRLKKMLKTKIKDKLFLNIVFKFLDIFGKGLALGYYISQWFANFLLQPLDHYIKQESLLDVKSNKERNYVARMKRQGIKNYTTPKYKSGASHYIRYMDDMVIFGNNKKEVHLIVKRIYEYLKNKLGLKLKEDWQVFRFDYFDKASGIRKGRFLDFMGFRFYRDKTTLRKSIMIRSTRKARRINKKEIVNWHDATSMLSYMGWISNTDTYNVYENYISENVDIKKLKLIVSKHSKKVSLEHKTVKRSKKYAKLDKRIVCE